jgi:anti-anti-sigma regulatory factor
MEIAVEQVAGQPQASILKLSGELDASNFREVIDAARGLYAAGTRRLLLDLADLTYMASSGLVALHSIALLMRGEEPPDPEAGWQAFHDVGQRVAEAGRDQNVALVAPQPAIDRVLERTGLKSTFEIHPDRASALAAG